MKTDQALDRADRIIIKLESVQNLPCHLRPHFRVSVEMIDAIRIGRTALGLSDIMKKHGQS